MALLITITFLLLTILLVLGLITSVSPKAMYHVKYTGYIFGCIVITSFAGIFCLFHKPGNSVNVKFAQIITKIMNFEWLFGIDIEVVDQHHILKTKQPFVVISNHQTIIDAVFVMQLPPRGTTVPIAKKSLFYVPIFGQVLWLFGTFFIDRKNPKSAVEALKKVASKMIEKNTSIWVFPEGSRYQCDKIMPFRNGAFHLAIQAQVPIIPVVIGNYRNVIDCRNKIFDRGVMRVKCLPPIETKGLSEDDVDDLSKKAFQIMTDEFTKDYEAKSYLYIDCK